MSGKSIIITILAVALSFFIGYNCYRQPGEAVPGIPDTVVVRETLRIAEPTLTETTLYKFVPYEVDCFWIVKDTVYVPIEVKTYEGSDYKAWISGFNASLDSMEVYPKTVYVTKYKNPRRFGLGLTAGYGYGKGGFSPYVGIGGYYRIW
jgi:hypothetical protein